MNDIVAIAAREDLTEILALQKKAFKVLADMWDRHDIEPMLETQEHITQEFGSNVILKYVSDGRIAGSVRGRMLPNGNCYVGKLSVDPAAQNKGIGRKLMLAIEEHFPDCRAFELFTSASTGNSRHLYESIGYRLTDRPRDDEYVVSYEKTNKSKPK